MKNVSSIIRAGIMLAVFVLYFSGTSLGQGPMLFGVAHDGGSDNQGIIFHYDRFSGAQIIDYSFTIEIPGRNPVYTELTTGDNGKFYGVTGSGGVNGAGVIFEWNPTTNTYKKKIDLVKADGNSPQGSLVLSGGKFYGMTVAGGTNDAGVIFEWDPATNAYTKKIDLGNELGANPYGSLTLYGGKFYGMTRNGGSDGNGVIFEWDPSTNICSKKIALLYETGSGPYGSLTLSGGKFYGMTCNGGSNGKGVIFEWDPSTNIYTKKIDLSAANGSNPYGSLKISGGKFYGMTRKGGSNNSGVIFEWNPATNTYTKKIDLSSSVGSNPTGSLGLNNGKFYGMTYDGGANGLGVIFEWNPATNVYTKKIDLSSSIGCNPYGSMILNGGKFIGMTNSGGAGYGIIFEWDPLNNTYSKKVILELTTGSWPSGSLALNGGKFYGTTFSGGTYGAGVIFEWDIPTNTYTKKIDLNDAIGSYPNGSLALSGGKYYGTTWAGGSNNWGVIFEWNPANNSYTKKIDLSSAIGGAPYCTLALYGGKFYGTTSQGGANSVGVIFEYDPATNTYIKKVDLSSAIGCYPECSLILSGGKFYGMTSSGGSNNLGVIFEWNPATNAYTKKIDLSSANGSQPMGSLTLCGGKFYGMTNYGGSNSCGVIFEWDPATNVYTSKINLSTALGSKPKGTLTLSGGKFYGMTYQGGSSDFGVIFEWDPVTNSYTKKVDLTGPNGKNPTFTQFFALENTPPILCGSPVDVSCNGGSNGSVNITVYSGTAPLTYSWNNSATTQNINGLTPGTYAVTVTDAASNTVAGSWQVKMPDALIASTLVVSNIDCFGGNTGSVTVSAAGGNPPYNYSWSTIPGQTTQTASGLTAGTYLVTVTDVKNCSAVSSVTLTQPSQWMPGLTGATSVCQNITGNTYFTESGMSNYQWVISNGGTATSGGTTSDPTITITWNTPGAQSVTVGYYTPAGCTNTNSLMVEVNPLLPVSISIAPSANPAVAGTVVTFTAIPVNGGSTPVYQWQVNGFNAGTNSPTFAYEPVNYDLVTCLLTSSETCVSGNPAVSGSVPMIIDSVPDSITVTGNVGNLDTHCYDATQTITIAGGATTFIVQNGGNAIIIAGQKILFKPGTLVQYGGNLSAYITTTGAYCINPSSPFNILAVPEETPSETESSLFKVYPNPTTGHFIIELSDDIPLSSVFRIQIYGMRGDRLLIEQFTGAKKHEFTLEGKPSGVYFILLFCGKNQASQKIIMQ
jgi:uncharacterized repeat protein (TIGR03803 family)